MVTMVSSTSVFAFIRYKCARGMRTASDGHENVYGLS
jgi:hypothetical protein